MSAVLATSAASFSIAHNHPTMSVQPSVQDRLLTNSVMDAANALGILFEEHVIVEPGGDSFSFRAAGLINGATRPKTRAASRPKKGKG
jgi:DNA repair protein RadC